MDQPMGSNVYSSVLGYSVHMLVLFNSSTFQKRQRKLHWFQKSSSQDVLMDILTVLVIPRCNFLPFAQRNDLWIKVLTNFFMFSRF